MTWRKNNINFLLGKSTKYYIGYYTCIIMAEVLEIKLDGYKTFFLYCETINDNRSTHVCVNEQSQFQADLESMYVWGEGLSEEQAKEARTMTAVRQNPYPYISVERWRDILKKNDFNLEKE